MHPVLPSAPDKARFVAAMFDRIAARYDLMNTLMTAGQDRVWRAAVVAAVQAGQSPLTSILDVGAGSGKLSQALARALPGAEVIALDFSGPMLRAGAGRGERVQPVQADALRLPFADGRFDAVVSAFVLRNLSDLGLGLAEQVRVLRPGGRLVALETTPGPRNALRPLASLYFRHIVPLLGCVIAREPVAYTYLPESSAVFFEPERIAQVLREQQLQHIQVQRCGLGAVAITRGDKRTTGAVR